MLDMNQVVCRANVLFVTLDCLRCDVAQRCTARGGTPHLARCLPPQGWEARETPGTFVSANKVLGWNVVSHYVSGHG